MRGGGDGAPHLRFSPTTPHQTIAPSAHRPIDTIGTGTGCGFPACGEARPAAGWMGGAGLGTATVPIGTASVRSRATTDYGVLGWRGGLGTAKGLLHYVVTPMLRRPIETWGGGAGLWTSVVQDDLETHVRMHIP